MQSLQARIDSFQKTRRVKRYPNKPSSSVASVKWPHPSDFKANANTLAEAGFFFSPSWDDRDSVACFLCGKELSDWDANDDPFQIHHTKCQNTCAWAVVRCGLTEDIDSKGRFVFKNRARLPPSKTMEKARLATFGEDWWPHDREPGHGATSAKMAQAGFVYTPQAADDDTVTCLYCNLSLGGWEREDDPSREHRKRDSKSRTTCPFLAFSEQQSDDELAIMDPAPSRSRRGKGRSMTSSTSSKPRRKTRATRGKSIKASAPLSQRSPSPSQIVIHEQEPETVPELSVNVSNAHTPPHIAQNNQDPIVSLSPAGQPIVARPECLTDHERTMSLEQWIRREISLGYERLLMDGQRQIELFQAKAVELRRCIDEL